MYACYFIVGFIICWVFGNPLPETGRQNEALLLPEIQKWILKYRFTRDITHFIVSGITAYYGLNHKNYVSSLINAIMP